MLCKANAVGLIGTYKAWLFAKPLVLTPLQQIHQNFGYKLVNGAIVANDWADLTDET
jgi:hypothetical protein